MDSAFSNDRLPVNAANPIETTACISQIEHQHAPSFCISVKTEDTNDSYDTTCINRGEIEDESLHDQTAASDHITVEECWKKEVEEYLTGVEGADGGRVERPRNSFGDVTENGYQEMPDVIRRVTNTDYCRSEGLDFSDMIEVEECWKKEVEESLTGTQGTDGYQAEASLNILCGDVMENGQYEMPGIVKDITTNTDDLGECRKDQAVMEDERQEVNISPDSPHPQSETPPGISRSKCNLQALSQSSLEDHIRSDHPEVSPSLQCTSSSSPSHINSKDSIDRFPCVTCTFTTDSKMLLQHHIDTKHLGVSCAPECKMCICLTNGKRKDKEVDKSLACPQCDYVTTLKDYLRKHVKTIHSNSRVHNCAECSYATNNRTHLKTHMNAVHLKKKDFACEQCSFKTALKCNLTSHINNVHIKEKNFSCPECEFKASARYLVVKHIKTKHVEQREFKCNQCDYGAISESILKRHIESVHLKLKPFSCLECSFTAHRKSNLTDHIDAVHKKKKNFFCSECPFESCHKRSLDKHVRATHKKTSLTEHIDDVPKKNFACPECTYKGATLRQLTRHTIAIHLKLKPFGCDECDFRTARKDIVAVHKKTIHLKLRDIPCDQCDFKGSTRQNVALHKLRTHAEKNLACPDCDFRTADSQMLKRHINKVHRKGTLFKCKECSFSTAYRTSLRKHTKAVHGGDGPTHICKQCGLAAASDPLLRRHVRQTHERAKSAQPAKRRRLTGPQLVPVATSDAAKPYACSECSLKASCENELKAHMASVHSVNCEDGEENEVSVNRCTDQSLYEVRRLYGCQECENPDVPKSPFRKHVVIPMSRIEFLFG